MDLIAVRLLAPVASQTGGHWNRGETAGFPPEIAAALVARGVAVAADAQKAPAQPSADKMIGRAPAKKTP